METWKLIDGFEGKYAVNRNGDVKNLKSGNLVKQRDNGVGYKKVYLWADGIGESRMYVHRLVASAFLPNKGNRKEVNHIDGNPANNNVSNLEWVSSSENTKHAIYSGALCAWGNKARPIEAISLDGGNVLRFATISEAEKAIGSRHITDVLKGKRKMCKGYTFRYIEGGDARANFEYISSEREAEAVS